MAPKPIITDYELVNLPDDSVGGEDENNVSLEDLSSLFSKLSNQSPEIINEALSQLNQDASESSDSDIQSDDQEVENSAIDSPIPNDTDSANGADSTEDSEIQAGEDDGECSPTPESIFEALLFVGNPEDGYLTTEQVCTLMPGVTEEEVQQLADSISLKWQQDNRPYKLERKADSWRMVLDNSFAPVRDKFYSSVREFQLPQSAINALAIVAYKQPITAQQVGQSIGQDHPTAILNQLVRRNLLQVEKKITTLTDPDNIKAKPVVQKVNLYRTTNRFLELYGLETLDDLPTIEEIL